MLDAVYASVHTGLMASDLAPYRMCLAVNMVTKLISPPLAFRYTLLGSSSQAGVLKLYFRLV